MAKRLTVILALGFVLVGWACWRAVPSGARVEAVARAQERGFAALVGEKPQRKTVTWSREVTPRMAKCNITSLPFSAAFDLWVRTSEGSDQANTAAITASPWFEMLYASTSGGYHYFNCTLGLPVPDPPPTAFLFRYPATGSGIQSGGMRISTSAGNCYLQMEHSSTPIGDKGQTHSKEGKVAENWVDLPGSVTDITVTALGDGEVGSLTGEVWTPASSFTGSIAQNITAFVLSGTYDPDDWGDLRALGVYPMSFENIKFGGEAVDFGDSYPEQVWYGGGGGATLYEKGEGANIYLYGDTVGGPQPGWSGVTLSAPYLFEFDLTAVKKIMGETLDTLEVWCPAVRQLTEAGADAGPTKKAVSEWDGYVAKQTTGWHTKDTRDPDVLPNVLFYCDTASARSHGLEVKQEMLWRVADAGKDDFNGDYWASGTKANGYEIYTNGYGLLYHDGNHWCFGLSLTSSTYYEQVDDGTTLPTDSAFDFGDYTDTLNEDPPPVWVNGIGPPPTVAKVTTAGVGDSADALSFQHDLRLAIHGWPVSATSRTASPYMTNIATVTHPAAVSIYGTDGAIAHPDWVASAGVTTPDAAGDFTVSTPGATLTLGLPNNYVQRQADVGNVGAVPVPDAYLYREQGYYYGHETYPENAEAVYDWRGWAYLYCRMNVPAAGDVTLTLTHYHAEIFGDTHLTGGDRQTEYTYSPGDAATFVSICTAKAGTAQPLVWDLWTPLPLAIVTEVKLTFSQAGAYRMRDWQLRLDSGNTQITPRRLATTPHTALKHFESMRYADGGASGHVDGLTLKSLWQPDQNKGNTLEPTVGTLLPLYSRESGGDLTGPKTAYQYVRHIQVSGSGWTVNYDEAAEDAHMIDADDTALRDLYPWDIIPGTYTGA